MQVELQSGQMRFVLGGSERDAKAHVHDADERSAARPTDHSGADEGVSNPERFDHGCFMEFSGEEENQEIQTPPARCAGWDLADGARGHRSRPGIPKMH